MSDFSDDELSGIFNDLNPEDFAIQTTARVETYLSGSPNVGDEAFFKFVDHNIEVLRTSALAAGGNDINPVAVLASASTQWIFSPEANESMGDYIARLHDEAKRLGATWCFISRFTMVAATPGGSFQDEDIADSKRGVKMLEEESLSRGVVFYGARTEDGQMQRRHGIMLVEDGALTPPVFGNPEQPFEIFDEILG